MYTLQKLNEIIEPELADIGLELVELQYNKGKHSSIRVFVWEEGGVSLDRCTEVSRRLSELLDRKDIIAERYRLEVSSPGLDRLLKTDKDFQRQLNRKVKVIVQDGENTKTIIGQIEDINDNGVTFHTKEGDVCTPLDEIISAKVLVEF